MGTGVQPGAAGAPPLREDVMLDDIEKSMKKQDDEAKAAKDAADAKAKAELEAKARAEVAAASGGDPRVKALEEALRISEEGRRRTEEQMRSVAPAPKKEEPVELTRDQVQELYAKDPLAAIEYLQTKSMKAIDDNIARRIEPLVSGGATSAREMAKTKYAEEFQVLGAEIEKTLNDPRVNKSAMGQLQAWDDLIAYVRGQPGNFEKLIEHRTKKERDKAAEEAKAREAAGAGAHTRSDVRAPAPATSGDLDDVEREIARTIHPELDPEQAYSDYKKWRGVAR